MLAEYRIERTGDDGLLVPHEALADRHAEPCRRETWRRKGLIGLFRHTGSLYHMAPHSAARAALADAGAISSIPPMRPILLFSSLAAAALAGGCTSLAVQTSAPFADVGDAEPLAPDVGALEALHAPRFELLPVPEIPPPTLIERLREGFALPAEDDASVARELAWFEGNAAYVDRVLTRAEPILYHIAEALEARGMPADLALLPIVESAFDPFAYSHGRAAGLWQIIPGTGRRLGLKQNWWFDGRRDLFESTRAALDYLQALHDMFDGDWLLAVAGYNSGEGNVTRAIRRAEHDGSPIDFWHIREYLPRETRTYVPRLLAIRDLVAEAEARGIQLPSIEDAPRLAVVETDGQIDMTVAAELAELSVDEMYQLNPGVNRWATDPEGPHRLVVPIDRAAAFRTRLASLTDEDRVQWTRYQIASGDTLIDIASRFSTTPEVLKAINELPGNTIRAGSHLMVPHAVKSMDAYTASVDARRQQRAEQARPGTRRTHVVRSGESLWSIARSYDVGVRALAAWNSMAPGDVLSIGRELVIWTENGAPATASAAASVPQAIREINYLVRRGDSLAAIARRFRVTVNNIVEWNDIAVSDYLQPGQRLVMYVDITEQSS